MISDIDQLEDESSQKVNESFQLELEGKPQTIQQNLLQEIDDGKSQSNLDSLYGKVESNSQLNQESLQI